MKKSYKAPALGIIFLGNTDVIMASDATYFNPDWIGDDGGTF